MTIAAPPLSVDLDAGGKNRAASLRLRERKETFSGVDMLDDLSMIGFTDECQLIAGVVILLLNV